MLSLNIKNEVSFQAQLKLLELPSAKRKQLLRKIATQVRKDSRQRIQRQSDLDNSPFTGRKANRDGKTRKGKMLKNLAKAKHLKIRAEANKAVIGYPNRLTGKIAKQHQQGHSERWTMRRYKRQQGKPDYGAPATREQAKALLGEGFKIKRASGRGWKTPSIKWITNNLTIGKAGAVLRSMRDKKPAESWTIDLPARAWLGSSKKENIEHIEHIINEFIPN